jgi:hypothetical protein
MSFNHERGFGHHTGGTSTPAFGEANAKRNRENGKRFPSLF